MACSLLPMGGRNECALPQSIAYYTGQSPVKHPKRCWSYFGKAMPTVKEMNGKLIPSLITVVHYIK